MPVSGKRLRILLPWQGLLKLILLVGGGLHLQDCSAFAFGRSYISTRQYTTATETELNLFSNLLKGNRISNGKTNGQQQPFSNGETANNNGARGGPSSFFSNGSGGEQQIPFVIERLGDRPGEQVFQDIAEVCISVFFNEGRTGRALPPWKEAQLSYLRLIQAADLRRRRLRDQKKNAMFCAYRVEEASSNDFQSRPLILNLNEVYNLDPDAASASGPVDYVRGDVLGFCEVSMVPFGLSPSTFNSAYGVEDDDNIYDDDEDENSDNLNSKRMIPKRMRYSEVDRPVLTNLSVKLEARKSGVGSKLLEACERAARLWGKNEMVLEVEQENVAARQWYQKRGYRVLFSDPTSKRYDVNGLLLKKVKCTRQILRKSLIFRHPQTRVVNDDAAKSTFDNFGLGVLRRLRDNVLQGAS